MAIGLNTGDNTPRRLAHSFENMQRVARGFVTAAYDGIEPDVNELQELEDRFSAGVSELEAFDRTYESYPYQGTLLIYKNAYLDTIRMLKQVLEVGSHGTH